ncbi:MAG: CdaR family protein [Dehalococcoidia bacterium]|nr:CdaR family protein [Dehalococcoidia bacterium]
MLGIVREVLVDTLWVSRFLLRGMGDSVRRNSGWAIVALILSAILWVIVTGEQHPPKVDVFSSPIPVEMVNVPSDLGVLGEVQFVRVRISALPEVWARITAGSFRATADLSGVRPGTQEAGVRVTPSDGQVRVLEVIPPKIPVMVEALDSRQVSVKVNLVGTAPLGVSIDKPQTSLSQVIARGPTPLVGQVQSANVDIPLEGLRVAINNQSFKLIPRNSAGNRIEGVTLDPPAVEVTLPVEQQITYRSVSLLPSVQGQVPEGYWISSLRVDPAAVTVAGSREALEPLTFLNTQPIDVSKLENALVKAVNIALPQGLTLIEPKSGSILVFISVSPVQGTQTFSVTPTLNGISPDLKATAESIPVTISGPLPRLRQIRVTDIIVIVDLKGLGPGTHSVKPLITVPVGLEVIQPPGSIPVTVSKG